MASRPSRRRSSARSSASSSPGTPRCIERSTTGGIPGPLPVGPGPTGNGPGMPPVVLRSMHLGVPGELDADDRADDLLREGRDAIEEGKYDRALDRLNRLIELKTSRTDAALYWKAYSLAKLGRRADALSALADLQQQFKKSSWLGQARALDLE